MSLGHRSNARKTPYNGRMKPCINCGLIYSRNPKFSATQWRLSELCSRECSGEWRTKRDGFKSKGERWRRKVGKLPFGTPEHRALVSRTTREGMLAPEVQAKLHKKRKKMSYKHRQIYSDRLAGRMPKNIMVPGTQRLGRFANIQRGFFDINGKQMFFRSKWEANYALYLDFLKKNKEIKGWEYEAEVFMFEQIRLGTRSYKPDFKVTNKNGNVEYHEVKGYMDAQSRTKLRRMKKYYPDKKVVLIEQGFYRDLNKNWGRLLKFY
jgi:hypothetical protein